MTTSSLPAWSTRRGSALWVLPVAALVACGGGGKSSQDDGVGVIVVEEETPAPELVLSIERPSVIAGESVGWGLTLVHHDGDTESVEGTISSDLEALRFGAGDVMMPRVAGTHTLTARAEVDGEVQTLTGALTVAPAAAAVVDLELSDEAFAAGDGVEWRVFAWDAYDNPLPTAGVTPDAGVGDLTITSSRIEGTTPGAYTVDAVVEGIVDSEVVIVTPGGAAAVELTLSDVQLELYETTSATVEIVDAHGNPTVDSWTLSVIGTDVESDDYALSWNNITFYDEGAFTVRVDVDGTSLYDEVGPLLIDSTGPELEIDEPERGGWNDGLDGVVSGTVSDSYSGVGALTVDGVVVTPESDGSFSTDTTWVFGTNVVETQATDGDGNVSTDTRAVLAGDFLPWGDPVSEGFTARLHEGDGGLGTLEVLGEDLVSDIDLDSLIPSPVFSDSEESCIDLGWLGRYCFTWYALTLYVNNAQFSSVDLDLDPGLLGRLNGDFYVNDVSLDWHADATVAEIDFSGSGDITADSIDVLMVFVPSVDSSGNIDIGLTTVIAETQNFYFDWDSWLYDALDFFGLDSSISGLIAAYIETALEDVVEDQVPELLGDTLQDLEIAFDLDLNGVTYAIDAVPESIDVDQTGITLALETTVEPDTWVKSHYGLGSLHGAFEGPTYTGAPGTILGVNLDFLNQFFMAAWGGGLLDMEMGSDSLGLDVSDLEFLLPGLTDLNITTEALLPPVVVPDGVDALLELQVGDLLLTLYNGDAVSGNEMIQVYVTAFVEMDVTASSDGTSLNPALGDMELYFDVVVPEANTVGAADTEALLELLVPLLLPTLTDALTEVPIPDIEGFSVTGVTVDTDGPEDGVLTLGGDLTTR